MFEKVAFTMCPICCMAMCADSEGNRIALHPLKGDRA